MRCAAFSLLLLCGLAVRPAAAQTMSVDDYWRLTKARLTVAAAEWQDRITSAQQANGDRQRLLAGSAAVTKQYAPKYNQVFVDFGMSQDMYLHFPSEHASEVESYLEDNTDFKLELDALQQNIKSLMDTFDAIAGPILSGESR